MVEVHDVIVHTMREQNKVADVLRIERHFELQCVFNRANARHGVNGSANAAETLGEEPSFARIASTKNGLDTAPHGGGSPRLGDSAVFDFYIDAEVAFDSANRVNCDAFAHKFSANPKKI